MAPGISRTTFDVKSSLDIPVRRIENLLKDIDVTKDVCPVEISSRVLERCAGEIARCLHLVLYNVT